MKGVFLIGVAIIASAIVFVWYQLPEAMQPAVGTILLIGLPVLYLAERALGKICAFKAIVAQSRPAPPPARPRPERRRVSTHNARATQAKPRGRVQVS